MTFTTPNIERITRRFYERFHEIRAIFLTRMQGVDATTMREEYAVLILNRLMALYFLQHKGFLDGDTDYLFQRLRKMQFEFARNIFYRQFLLVLFHEGFSQPVSQRSSETQELLGTIPYLDDELFAPHLYERQFPALTIADEAFELLFCFFDTYHWYLDERPLQSEYELTPSLIGYIFEKYINQQELGAYYTKEDVTAYIAKNTILPCLFEHLQQILPTLLEPGGKCWQLLQRNPDHYIYPTVQSYDSLPMETEQEYNIRLNGYLKLRERLSTGEIQHIDDFITYNLDICHFIEDIIGQIQEPVHLQSFYQFLQQITILDPTCGAGVFLITALDILEPLYRACLEHILDLEIEHFPQGHPALDADYRHAILTMIISNNLYGVDIMEQATEICKLRLLLKLAGHAQVIADLQPLPALHCNIRTGNALVGYTWEDSPLRPDKVASREELDHALAKEYGIDIARKDELERWYTSHRPFHWSLEFVEIGRRGGFDVIIGNPPYVEYDARKFPYQLRDFRTLSCSNLYTCVTERCQQLLSPHGRHGMILPLASFSTRNMIPLIENFRRWFPQSWLSFYHFRPAMLFSGGKVASIPTTIYLAKTEGPEQRFSTHLAKWSIEHREFLFSTLTYCQITAADDPENRHYYPKFGHPLENRIMEKVLQHQKVRSYLAGASNTNDMYYRSAGGLYWKVFTNFVWPYQTTSNKRCSFQDSFERDVFVALFNSSLFWWYYTVTFDTFNLKDYMIFGFRFSYPERSAMIRQLQILCQQLMQDYQKHAVHLKRGTTGSYTIYARKSKAIIDNIDEVLAHHYGFTDEEFQFLINYDIKYRCTPTSSASN